MFRLHKNTDSKAYRILDRDCRRSISQIFHSIILPCPISLFDLFFLFGCLLFPWQLWFCQAPYKRKHCLIWRTRARVVQCSAQFSLFRLLAIFTISSSPVCIVSKSKLCIFVLKDIEKNQDIICQSVKLFCISYVFEYPKIYFAFNKLNTLVGCA